MSIAESTTVAEVESRRTQASRLRRIEELRRVWALDLRMQVKVASDALVMSVSLSDLCLEKVELVSPEGETLGGLTSQESWPLDKEGKFHVVPTFYSLAERDEDFGYLRLVSFEQVAERLITEETLDNVENEQSEIAVIRDSLDNLATPDQK